MNYSNQQNMQFNQVQNQQQNWNTMPQQGMTSVNDIYNNTIKAQQVQMQNAGRKTKFGVSVAVFAAFIYVIQYYSSFTATLLIFGYLLMYEKDDYLTKTAMKAFLLDAIFLLISTLIHLIPDGWGIIVELIGLLNIYIPSTIPVVSSLVLLLSSILSYIKTVLFMLCIFSALKGKEVKIPLIENFYNKHIA